MPRSKDLKRLVRGRMKKTGEAYTSARAHIIKKQPPRKAAPDLAALAGMSDAKVVEKTGRSWKQWVDLLDRLGAKQMLHREIAALVNQKYNVGGWWSQTVTVGYERIKGLRAHGQRLDGTYEASKSRTFNVPVTTLFEAWANARTRKRWLDESVKVRTATSPKSMRLGWSDGSIVAVWFTAKGDSKSGVALAHTKLPDRATADRLKRYWAERLAALGEVLNRR